jgi:ABC-2 type transport system permease protein
MSGLVDVYLATIRVSLAESFQYRVANFLWLIGMVAEPVIYLVVWSTVAAEQPGGMVAGYTATDFAAYYIVWTLVRQMNIVLTPYAWEQRVRLGELSQALLRPLHPFHADIAGFSGFKVVTLLMWVPVAAVLTLLFKPSLDPMPWQVAAFLVALVTGFVVRFVLLWVLGLVTFWTTRVSAVFELYFTLELLFSGRLVPLALLPEWAQRVSLVLPFQWTFGFPIELLVGQRSPAQTVLGFGAQLVWFVIGVTLLRVSWRAAVRRYSAVGA